MHLNFRWNLLILIYLLSLTKILVFSVFLPCSGNRSGVAPFEVGLLIETRKGKPLVGTPIRLKLRKECAPRGNLVNHKI